MKKLNLMALAMLAAAVTVSCSKDEVTDVSPSRVIGFKAMTDNPIDRAGNDVETANIYRFRVWGCTTANGSTSDHVMLFNEQIVLKNKETNLWEYSPVQYWAYNKDYYFVALTTNQEEQPMYTYTAPTTHDASLKVAGFNGYGSVLFEQDKANGASDLVFAAKAVATGDNVNAMEAVDFQFQHLLSRISVKITNNIENPIYKLAVTDLNIGNTTKNATINLGTAPLAWTPNTDVCGFSLAVAAPAVLQKGFRQSSPAYIIPGEQELNVSFKAVTYISSNGTDVKYNTETITGTVKATFEMGKSYLFTASVTEDNINPSGAKPIEFTVTGVTDWGSDIEGSVTIPEN